MANDMIRIVIVDDIEETRESVAKLISLEPDMEVVGAASGGEEAVEVVKRERPNIVLMDINMPPGIDGLEATKIIVNNVPESPVIMMSIQGDQDYMRRSMLAGAREFLSKPFSADELVNAIRNVNEAERHRRERYQAMPTFAPAPTAVPQRGKVISFFSPKGGVGRTTIATNLAVALQQTTDRPVVLVDGSLPFGDIAVILDMKARSKTIADLVGSFDTLDGDILESALVTHSSGIKVLLAPPTPEAAELITAGNMKRVLELLSERYAYVIVDTWPSFQEVVLAMLDAADVILTLMTLEITTMKNVRSFLDVVGKLGYDERKVQLVANRNDSSGGIRTTDVEQSLGRPIPHTIVSDGRALVLAVNRGVPFVITHRDSQVAKDVFALAAKLAGEQVRPEPEVPPAPRAAPRGGLRLFSR